MRIKRKELMELFEQNYIPEPNSGCWLWMKNKGYGVLAHKGAVFIAHRLGWELFNRRKIPEGLLACHHCDTPSCVNPKHIFIGTHSDNMRDRIKKGRYLLGPMWHLKINSIRKPKPV